MVTTNTVSSIHSQATPDIGLLPPHSIEAEQSLLGALMLDNTRWDEVADRMASAMFYRPAHGLVFEAMRRLSFQGSPLDLVTISEALEEHHQLEGIGGLAYLAEITQHTVSTDNVEAYANIIRDRYQLRRLSHTCNEINRQALNPEGRDAGAIIEDAERELFHIVEERPHELSSVNDMLSRAIDIIDAAYKAKDGITGVPTGYADLDEMTAGWQPTDLIVLAGRPSMGKTSMGLGFVERALFSTATTAQGPIFVFSLEMSQEQLMLRLLASVGQISLQKLRTGLLDDDDWPKLSAATARITELSGRLFIDDESGISASALQSRARRLARRHGQPSMILIDYLQLLHESGNENRNLEVGTISRILKGMAKELRVPVVVLSQLNRSLEQRPNKRPVMSDLRESGAIEQDADVIAFVYRDEVYHPDNPDNEGLAELIIAKQRNGPVGTVNMTFISAYTRFESLEWKHKQEDWS